MGITGRAIPKVINGRQYIIFKGYPGLRTLFPGTIYLAKNRKIITMAIGALGIKHMVRSGAILTICITVPLTILECFLEDRATMTDLIGNVYSDLAKVGIQSIIAAIAGLAIGAYTSIAWIPIGLSIGIGVIFGLALEGLDTKYQLTDRLVDVLEELQVQTKSFQYRGQESQFIGQAKLREMHFF
ncbi:MAG: hypothetical protein KJP07_02165 [Desulfatitalea sp.]|nr:hypothetical protein [Desulfatitalea sp.]